MIPAPLIPVPRDSLLSTPAVEALLAADPVATRVRQKELSPQPGDLVGVRLNLNLLKATGQAIQTIHRATNRVGYRKNKGFYNGEACAYAQAVVLRHAYFNVAQAGREAIAQGQHAKFPMASVDGQFVAMAVPEDFCGVEVRFNPRTHHLFVDTDNRAIQRAEEVVILGHRAYARGRITYHTDLTAPARAGNAPSQAQVLPSTPSPTTAKVPTAAMVAPRSHP